MTMKINVEVISREIIKPDTPTPDHLRHYQFSLLDQFSPSGYMPLIYFYNTVDDHDKLCSQKDISSKLKLSLSRVLTYYYPLAGCVKDNSVDCNDEGALFLETQVDCQLSQIVPEPFEREFNKFFPYDQELKRFIVAIQINFFKCGTYAIGVLLRHKIADASSIATFIKNWAAVTAHGENAKFCPKFVSATLFPPKDVSELTTRFDSPPEKDIVMKRFVFSGSAIAALKEKYTDRTNLDNEILHPTRVEALSSFIWSRFTASTQTKKGLERSCVLLHTADLRKRIDPPLPDDQSFGNIVGFVVTLFSEITGQEDQNRYGLISKLRDAKNKINNEYAKKLQEGVFEEFGLLGILNDERVINQEKDLGMFSFTSLCRFPLYETDFGWGRPVWVASGGVAYGNLAVLIDTKSGDGIEAWIHLKDEDMAKFESDKELLSFLSCGQDGHG